MTGPRSPSPHLSAAPQAQEPMVTTSPRTSHPTIDKPAGKGSSSPSYDPSTGRAPRREVIPPHPMRSFRALTHDFPSEICGWHVHPEYEIHLITQTHGSFIAGDHVGTFAPGHVTMIGPNLPHDWMSDLNPGQVAVGRDAVIHFTDDWIRRSTEVMPELLEVDAVLRRSSRGLVFSGATARQAAETILDVQNAHGVEQLSHLFRLLTLFARAPEGESGAVASEWMGRPSNPYSEAAVEAGLSYIFEHLTDEIRLSTAARPAHMSEPTFSKYFKSATGLTFSQMVKKLRIAHARQLLDTTNRTITQIATLSGYNNIANFNRQFHSEVGATPSSYRRLAPSQKPPLQVLSLPRHATRD